MKPLAAVIVGLPYSQIVRETVEETKVPVFNRRTGEPDGTETEQHSRFFMGNRELPGDESPELTLTMDYDLDRIRLSSIEEDVCGRIVEIASDDDAGCLKELDWSKIGEVRDEVVRIFREVGIDVDPRVYLALSAV